ncbi:MAG TPA: hypothetical protein PKJ61_10420 [Propionicimonas sp.]|nr:hypothetical protein [Propionicimonas sp.]
MNLPKRLINLIGTVLVVGMLAVGIFMVAWPLYTGHLEVEAQRLSVAQSNDVQAARIQELAKQQAELPALTAELDGLRQQIPVTASLDQASKLAVAAAKATGSHLQTFAVGDTVAFTPPAGVVTDAAAAAPAPAPTDGSAAESPRLQTSVSFTITTDSTAQVAEFVDKLRTGSRLVQIVQVLVSTGDEVPVVVTGTVTALIFVQQP